MKTLSLFLVLMVAFLDWVGIGLVYPMFSSMLFHPECPFLDPSVSEGVRGWYLGLLLATMSITQFFSSPVLGALSDQKGRRPIFIFSLALAVFGYIVAIGGIVSQSIFLLLTSRALIGIAAGNNAVASAAIVDLSTSENKAQHFGLYSMACGVGFTIGPFLGGFLSRNSFSIPFIAAGICTALNLLLIFLFFKETHHTPKAAQIRIGDGIAHIKKAFSNSSMRTVFLASLLFFFGWSFFYEFLPVTWIADYKFDAQQIGFFFAYGSGFYALSSGLLIRPFVSRFKASKILFSALTGLGIIVLLLLFPFPSYSIWFYSPTVNFLCALCFPTLNTFVSDATSKEAQGEMLGILQSLSAVAFAASPLIAGPLIGTNPHFPMLLGGIAFLVSALILSKLALSQNRV